MRTWASQHARCLGGTLGRFARQPLGSLFNILVIGVALLIRKLAVGLTWKP